MTENVFYLEDYRKYLVDAYELRLQRNPSYSMRAFARDLGMGVSTLSEVLNGKYGLSKKRVAQVVTALQLSEAQAQHFADLVQKEHARSNKDRDAAQMRVKSRVNFDEQTITLDSFKVISDWYHLAMLELMVLPDFDENPKVLAKRLAIPEKTVIEVIERLQRLDLVERTKQGLRPTDDFTTVGDNVPSQAIRKFHKQVLEKAAAALKTQPVEDREISTMVFAINKQDLPEAKKRLVKFRREFTGLLSKTENKDDVYCLGMQFFSLIDKGSLNEK